MKRALLLPARYPNAVLIGALLVTIAAICLILRLKPETSLGGLLDPNDRGMAAMAQVLSDFPVANEALVMATLPEGTAGDTQPLINFAERLRLATSNDPEAQGLVTPARYRPDPQTRRFVEDVIVPNGIYYLSAQQTDDFYARLTPAGMAQQLQRDAERLAVPGPAAGALAKALSADPLALREFLVDHLNNSAVPALGGTDGFFSSDRRSVLIRVGGTSSAGDFKFATRLTQTIDRLVGAANTDGLQIDIGGAYAMSAHSAAKIEADSYADIISTVLGLALLFAIACHRPWRLFLFAFVPVAAGIVWGFGAYAFFFPTITPLAAVVGGTLGAIGLDYTTHFITHYQEIRPTALDTRTAIAQTSVGLFLPSLAAWMTSIIGFAAAGISPIRVLRDFAIIGTLSLVGAWLSMIILLPAMLAKWSAGDASPFEGRFYSDQRIFAWLSRHAAALLIGAALLMAGLMTATSIHGFAIGIESDPMVLHPRPSPPLEAQRRIASRMNTTAGAIMVLLRADSWEKLVSAAHQVHQRVNSTALNAAGVTGAVGVDALLPDPINAASVAHALPPDFANQVERDFRAAIDHSDFVPGSFENYIRFLRQLAQPAGAPSIAAIEKYPELRQTFLPRSGSAGPIEALTLVITQSPLETREKRDTALSAVSEALADVPEATVTGTAALGHNLEFAIHRDLPRFIVISLACICCYLLLHFRSVSMAAFALLPIAISLVCVIACFCLAGIRLNVLHTVMAPLLIGINLDYGIFAAHAFRDSRDREELARHFGPALSGLLICGCATVIGFGSMVVTSIPAVRSLGWLINVGVISCVAATLLVQWPAMMVWHRRKGLDASSVASR